MNVTEATIEIMTDEGRQYTFHIHEPLAARVRIDRSDPIDFGLPIAEPELLTPPKPIQLTVTFGWPLNPRVSPFDMETREQ